MTWCLINHSGNFALFPVFHSAANIICRRCKRIWNVSSQCSTTLKYKLIVKEVGSTVGSAVVERATCRSRFKRSRIPISCHKMQPVFPKNVGHTHCTLNQAKRVQSVQPEKFGYCTMFCFYKEMLFVYEETVMRYFVFQKSGIWKVVCVVRCIRTCESSSFRHLKC